MFLTCCYALSLCLLTIVCVVYDCFLFSFRVLFMCLLCVYYLCICAMFIIVVLCLLCIILLFDLLFSLFLFSFGCLFLFKRYFVMPRQVEANRSKSKQTKANNTTHAHMCEDKRKQAQATTEGKLIMRVCVSVRVLLNNTNKMAAGTSTLKSTHTDIHTHTRTHARTHARAHTRTHAWRLVLILMKS